MTYVWDLLRPKGSPVEPSAAPVMPSVTAFMAREVRTLQLLLMDANVRIGDLTDALAAARATTTTAELVSLRRQAEQDRRNCLLLEERLAEVEGRSVRDKALNERSG